MTQLLQLSKPKYVKNLHRYLNKNQHQLKIVMYEYDHQKQSKL